MGPKTTALNCTLLCSMEKLVLGHSGWRLGLWPISATVIKLMYAGGEQILLDLSFVTERWSHIL